jgi:hypothetical protein
MSEPIEQYVRNQNEAAFDPSRAPSSVKRGRELTQTIRDTSVSRARPAVSHKSGASGDFKVKLQPKSTSTITRRRG